MLFIVFFTELYSYTEYTDFDLNKQAFQEHFEQYGKMTDTLPVFYRFWIT